MTSPAPQVNRLAHGAPAWPYRLQPALPGEGAGAAGRQVFLDLEDACAPLAKPEARHTIVKFLNEGDWTGKTRVVRVNDWTTEWTYRDVVTVVEGPAQS